MASMIGRFVLQNDGLSGSGIDGKVLGFDTGLDKQAFAQSKMAQFITQNGTVVFPDGRTEPWKASGVIEKPRAGGGSATMVIWGPDFPGISLDVLVRDKGRKEEALDAVRYYLRAKEILAGGAEANPVFNGAAGVFIACDKSDVPYGTVLFLPERLAKRCIEAGGEQEITGAQQWVHPDFKGDDQTVFSAAAMLYTALTGENPYLPRDGDTLRQDIREGVFVPLRLAAPGLDKNIDTLITEALEPDKKKTPGKKRPAPALLLKSIGDPGSSKTDFWFTPLQDSEKQKIAGELEQFRKNKEFTVKTRRFVIRNTTLIFICAAVVVGAALIVQGYVKRLQEMPNTRGMTPAEVAETYYGSFEKLDHEMMDACVSGKKAKIDIDMIINLYVISKTRQAYESVDTAMTAQDWLDRGRPQTDATVFGVTDLSINALSADISRDTVYLRANYRLWMPASFAGEDIEMPSDEEILSGTFVNPPPRSYEYADDLQLSWIKDSWRITEINRTVIR